MARRPIQDPPRREGLLLTFPIGFLGMENSQDVDTPPTMRRLQDDLRVNADLNADTAIVLSTIKIEESGPGTALRVPLLLDGCSRIDDGTIHIEQ